MTNAIYNARVVLAEKLVANLNTADWRIVSHSRESYKMYLKRNRQGDVLMTYSFADEIPRRFLAADIVSLLAESFVL